MNQACSIVEDLMPLYEEDLLQKETVAWLEEHLASCALCRKKLQQSSNLQVEAIVVPEVQSEKMIQKIHMKVNMYQIIFVCVSFILAMQTSLLNDSFGFIATFALLGFVLYYFYQNFKMVIIITLLPTFFWAMADALFDLNKGVADSVFLQLWQITMGALLIAAIHVGFAIIGGIIAWLVYKVKEGATV